MSKKYIYILILIVFVTFPATIMAQSPTDSTAAENNTVYTTQLTKPNIGRGLDKMASNAAENKTNNLQTRAAAEIARRIKALQELLVRLTNLKRLSQTTKTALSTQIQTQINELTALQEKIQQETDLATLKTYVQSIVTQHRIFVVFMPQVRLLGAADALLNVADRFTIFAGKLNTRIDQAKTAGNDTTALETQLSEMNAKIQDAQTQANSIISDVSPITPAGYPGNKTTLQNALTKLKAAIQDLKAAKMLGNQIIQGLAALKPASSTNPSTPSANTAL